MSITLSRGRGRWEVVEDSRVVQPTTSPDGSPAVVTNGQEQTARGRLTGSVRRERSPDAIVPLAWEWVHRPDVSILRGTFLLFFKAEEEPT
jgi:hypothetical protein